MPLPAPHERLVPVAVTMVNAPDLSLRGRFAPVAISGRYLQFVQSNDKTYQPIASVAAVTAQPLAALPPYGCGVPFTGVERLWQLHISARLRRPCNAPGLSLRGGRRPTWRPERAARGSALGVQSRSTRLDYGKAIGETATACTRLPRAQSALAMTNLGALRGRRWCYQTCSCQWRSLSAATYSIGGFPHNMPQHAPAAAGSNPSQIQRRIFLWI